MAASPDEALVSMQSATERENLVVFETDSRVSVDVPLPESVAPRSDSPYPLVFHAWSADSKTYLRDGKSGARRPLQIRRSVLRNARPARLVSDAVREFRTAVNDHAAAVDPGANAALPFSVSSVHSA